jgi:hypothetical protein
VDRLLGNRGRGRVTVADLPPAGTDGLTVFYEITSAVFTIAACLVAYLSYRYSRYAQSRAANDETVKRIARDVVTATTDQLGTEQTSMSVTLRELRATVARIDSQGSAGLASRVAVLESELKTDIRELRDSLAKIDSQGTAGLGLLVGRVAVLESKMDVFWKNVALDVSKILHSPHPGWENLDALLEKFRDEAISPAEMGDLVRNLREIVDGRWPAAEVSRADKVAASLLLHAIEQTRT